VEVHAKVAGYIQRIFVDVGDKVKAGQVIAILEVPELSAQVQGAEAAIKRSRDAIRRAQSEVEKAKSAHAAAHFAYTRLKQASEARPGLIAEQELDDSRWPIVCHGSVHAHHRSVCWSRNQALRRYRFTYPGRHCLQYPGYALGPTG
jgi:multidrug resistance efflux pump